MAKVSSLSKKIIGRRMCRFDVAALHAVHHIKGRHQLAGRMHRHLKPAARHRFDMLGKGFRSAINGVQRLGETRRQAPAHGNLRMHGRRHAGRQHTGNTSMFDQGATIHEKLRMPGSRFVGDQDKPQAQQLAAPL